MNNFDHILTFIRKKTFIKKKKGRKKKRKNHRERSLCQRSRALNRKVSLATRWSFFFFFFQDEREVLQVVSRDSENNIITGFKQTRGRKIRKFHEEG